MRWIAPLLGGILLATLGVGAASADSTATWLRGYPQQADNGCVEYVAQWSDGTFTSTPWDCGAGVARAGSLTASRGYPQQAANRCIEYVTEWSDGSYTWVPFECPPGIVYYKPDTGPGGAGATNTLPVLQPANPTHAAPLPVLEPIPPGAPTTPAAPSATPGWREYTLTSSGFAISLPNDWQQIDISELDFSGTPAEFANLFKFFAIDGREEALLSVLKSPRTGPDSLFAILERHSGGSSGEPSAGSSRTISSEEISLPAGRTLRVVIERESNGITIRGVSFLIVVGDHFYLLDLETPASNFNHFEPIFDQIARSLRPL